MSLSLVFFVAVYLGSLLLAITRSPVFGLYAYLFAFYLHPQSRYWGASLPDLRWSLIAAVVTVLTLIFRGNPSRQTSVFKSTGFVLFGLFVLWVLLQSLWAVHPRLHSEQVTLFAKYLILFYLIHNLCQTIDDIKAFAYCHVAGCFYLGWQAYGVSSGGRLENMGGPGIGDSNRFAMQLVTGLIFAGYLLIAAKGWTRVALFAAIPFILNGIILTGSRGAIVAMLGAGLLIPFFTTRYVRRLTFIFGILGVVLFGILANDLLVERLESILTVLDKSEQADKSASSRLEIFNAQMRMFGNHKLGTGARGTLVLSPAYIPAQFLDPKTGHRASHNTYASVLVDHGIPGALLFAGITIWAVRRLRRLAKSVRSDETRRTEALLITSTAASFLALLAGGAFGNYIKMEVFYWMLALISAIYAQHQFSPTRKTGRV